MSLLQSARVRNRFVGCLFVEVVGLLVVVEEQATGGGGRKAC